jgi:hypothetical protein
VTIFVFTGDVCRWDSYHAKKLFFDVSSASTAVDACRVALRGSDDVDKYRAADRCKLQLMRLERWAEVSVADPYRMAGAAATGANLLAHRANIFNVVGAHDVRNSEGAKYVPVRRGDFRNIEPVWLHFKKERQCKNFENGKMMKLRDIRAIQKIRGPSRVIFLYHTSSWQWASGSTRYNSTTIYSSYNPCIHSSYK